MTDGAPTRQEAASRTIEGPVKSAMAARLQGIGIDQTDFVR
jgi:hypothetical protein